MFYILQTACGQNCSTEGGNFDSSFDAEKGVGTIVIAKPLDAEQRSIYNMSVEVTDGTNVAVTQVFIKVLDNNDNGPEFSQPNYDVTISEDVLPDTEILQVEATDRDEKHKLSYTIHSSIDSVSMRKFRIDATTGVLYIAERLDHEAQDKHILNIMVRDQEFPYRRNMARVIVNVEDANDHSPYFTSPLYEASVFESAALGSAVLQVTALDKDRGENAELLYTIEAGNTGNTFKIEPILGIITVSKEPDMTTMGQFVLSIKVTDQGSPPMSATAIVRISVTMSDNSHPKFAQKEYQAEVNENVDIGTSVILISAISQSTLIYEVKDGNIEGVFTINPYSGVITNQKALDYERISSYQLIVQATNMAGMASNATVNIQIVDENDNPPIFLFSQYSGSLSEVAPVNSIVRSLGNNPLVIRATDADSNQNALLVYQIVESTAKKFFTVDSSTGAIRTIASLDHETIAHFHFHVHVRDSGNPQLTAESPAEVNIEVTDVNDNPPVFTQAVFETVLLLPTYVGVEILKVQATDPDSEVPAELTYSLMEGSLDHFFIDSNSGMLSIKNSSLSKDHYMLIVRVSDGKFYGTAMVTIMVKEAMDSGLHFTQSFYFASISENSTNITKVAIVNAIGNRLNEPLIYNILNPGNKFKIKSTSGVIQTTGVPFDREEQELFELVVEASRELDHLRVARVVVRVNIEDINDNSPVFVGLPYYAAVQVDAEPGTLIYRVTALDRDKGANGEVTYTLQEDYGHFEINPESGSVFLKEAFNSDLSNIEYGVIILAKDGGKPALSASVELPITIVNKAMPVFDKPFYTTSVNEDVEMHTPILSINATSPEGQGIIYIIVDGDPYNQFNIDFDTGVLNVISPLDYEITPVFKLTVRASDALTGARAEVTVDLLVNDVNDNPPIFDQSTYNATLSEASLIGTPVLQVVASDADSENNKVIQYQIVQDTYNSTDYFHIDSTSGLILTARMLDHESVQQSTLKVRATDHGFPPMSSEVLVNIYVTDMNDNPPVFNQLIYESYVSELAPRGHFVTCVQASDADSSDFDRLEYSILSGNDRTSFLMDSKRGIITLSNHRKQRMEPLYSLNVSVSDGLFTSTAQVHIRILGANLYSPSFSQSTYVAEVRENAAPGTKVIHVRATDGDPGTYGQISYAIINDFAKDRFLIDSNGQIITTERLDRESPMEGDISIFLRALDGGGRTTFCTVRVIVVDENDNAPQFLTVEFRASVRADVGRGHLVTQVQAIDPDDGVNSRITYSLYSEASVSVADLLEIDPDNGWMVTKSNFHQLKNTVLSFFVKAVDGGIPVKHSLIPVYIHVLPPEILLPSFTQPQYSFAIPEDMVIGSTVDSLRILPNQNVVFSTVNGERPENNKGGVFIIEQDTGTIKLDKRLDREMTPAFHFKIAATIPLDKVDIVFTVDIEIKVLDLNDNKPFFDASSYEAIIMEGMPVGTRLIQVKAIDRDWGANGQVTYALHTDSNPEKIMEVFSIDSNTGWISTLKDLDHEKDPTFTFSVVASDLGETFSLSSTILVSVSVTDINDNAPVFGHDIYREHVKESDPPGEVVAVLSTRDEDTSDINQQVSYHITGGNPRGRFALGLVQNEWKVYVKRPLDREEQDVYFLNITATDGLFVTQAMVEVTVTDVNDNSPVCDQVAYTALFPEDIPSNKIILKINAKDADIGPNGDIRYSLYGSGNNKFFLDPESGELKTLALLDREKIPVYNLIARATDGGGRFCQSDIRLILEDVNDNPPIFSSDHYNTCIYENTATKALLTRVQAMDPDLGYTLYLEYAFFVLLRFPKVTVTDGGSSPKQSTVWVVVQVLDENDNKPQFPEKVYQIKLPERDRKKRGEPIYRAFAFDKDEGPNAEISYSIVDGNDDGKFFIDPKTGMVSSRKQFTAGSYDILTIKAVDNGRPQKSSTARLHIEWIKKPPPSPVPLTFDEPFYNFTVMESDRVTEIVGVVSVQPANIPLWFDVVGGNFDSSFDAEKGVGTIVIAKPLDAEQRSIYNMSVEVTDGTNVAVTQVFIKVLDNNDNGPEFSQPNYDVTISEDVLPDTEILQVEATDRDEKHKLSYTIHSSIDSVSMRKFRIDATTGVLYIAERLDHEAQDKHILNIMVRDQEFPYRRNMARVIVNVEDANDHSPYFTSPLYEASVFESAALGSAVLQVTALDKDRGENAELLYTIEAGNTGNTFKIEPILGIITVSKEPDMTTMGQFVLSIKVTDQGSPPMSATAIVRISVTMSDNSHPKFAQKEYQAEVNENVDIGTSVILISAISQSTLIYEVKDGNIEGVFTINPYSGVITNQKALDYERISSYQLIVQATNMAGMASNATVNIQIVDENDNPPIFLFSQYSGSLSEVAPVNSIVRSLGNNPLVIRATDADSNQNALLVYQIVESTAKKFFTVDSSTGAIRTIASLDHETIAHFHFHVHVRDSGNPQLTAESPAEVNIEVTDVNDNPPVFTQAVFETVLLLPTYVGVEILKVQATDPDSEVPAELTYSLMEGSLDHFFIDSNSGMLSIKNSSLSKDHYMLIVRVSDGKFYGTAMVTIMVKEAMDSGLHFTQSFYFASISENSTNITKVAIVNAIGNRLNEPLIYNILNPGNKFKIKSTSGVIQTTGVPFDREEQELFELVVEASRELDHLRVARVVVRVNIEDINDNSPVFVGLPYYAAVQVDAEPGTLIYRVTALDRDKGANGEVTYTLQEDYGHFEINPESGSVFLKEAFNSDLSNIEYGVIILAKDGGKPALSASVELPITIVNKAMPVFDKPFYTTSVNEDVEMHTPILSINATSPEGQGIIYIIVDGDPYNQFNIDFDTGVLNVISPLDYEITPVFKLTVRASDALTGARAEVTVDLLVNDVNDNPPIFDQSTYNATLSEASLIGTPVLQVVASDADSENNKVIQYQIVQDTYNSTDYFHIDSTSGLILTARMLDHESVQQSTLKVRATDHGFPPMSSEVLVNIYVTDMNDNPPVFNQLIYESYVSELAPRGHFVTCVQASDADSSDFDRLEYSILSGNDRTSFLMDSKSGIITLSNHRKQRMEPLYSLNVSVSDGLFTSTAQVHIRILGANLYSPSFSQSTYVAEVRENAAPGTKVIHVRATDGDPGTYGQISYAIINDFAKDRFLIDSNGQIITTERLDRESPMEGDISIFLRALDGGGRTTFCTVRVIVVDENDNAPQFLTVEFRASVRADVGRGHLVTQVQAIDPDDGVNSRITYSLYSEASVSVADLLEIDPDNGWMVTKSNFHQLKNTVLSFFVKAVDGGIPVKHSLIPVYIHVLPPEILLPSFTQPQYSFAIPEDMVIGSTVDSLRILPNQNVVFSTVNGERPENNKGGVFIIEQDTGTIKLDKRLDREMTPAFHFKIAATIPLDKVDIVFTVDIEIKVLDLNDNKPFFDASSYEAIIMEGMPVGTRLIQVKAIDRDWGANGQVTYALHTDSNPEKIMEVFSIDSNTGWISTLKDLDHEKDPTFTFSVVASDLGETFSLSSTILVSVSVTDINDNAPVFGHDIYREHVKESDPPGEVVAVLSTRDEDTSDINQQVSYHITGGNPRGRFALGLVQNEWKVYVKRPLDREEQDVYFLNITATDGLFVTQAMVEVTVTDVNDNSPVCDQVAYTALFPEDIPSNKIILKINAKDADIGPNGDIRYSLYGSGNNKFFLDPESGELKTLALLDREKIPVYNLIARATDGGGRFCQSDIRLILEDVNDNPPIFSSDHYNTCIYENTATKALLTRVQAMDPDLGINRKVVYSLADSAGGYFSVDSSSGIIILEQPLDRELQSSYNISVKASDQSILKSLSSLATVTITVLDINDNPPVFERRDYLVTIPEDTSPGKEVLAVFATSKDIGTNAEITYLIRSGNERGKFKINPKTGGISVIEALDYEMCKDFYLVVEAKDGGTPALSAVATVNINLTDVNDNAPKFNQEVYSAVISEDASIGDSVIVLIAEDVDSPPNGQIHFSIVSGDRDNEFAVDPVLGLVKVKKKLDRERVSGYSLLIQATDSGIPAMSSTVTVNIDISDVNDNGPVFTPANYTAVIQENKPVGTSILQLMVTDRDSFHNGPPFTFTILSGNEEEEFVLDPHGILRSAVIFRHTDSPEYVLYIQAKDSGKPQQVSHSYVHVRVIEESIHKPTAIPLEIFIVTMEDDFPGGVIGKIHATDQDVYDVLTYALKSEQRSLFKVNAHDGKIIALGGLDSGKYILNVSVSDGRFQVPIDVIVHVEQLVQEMLQNTVTIRFENVSPEDFVGLHMHGFRRTLRNAVLSQKQDSLHIISIQPVAGTNQLDMLFAVQMHNGGFYKPAYLIQKLSNARRHLENVIRISAILEKNCSGLDCQEQHCEQSLSIDSHSLMTYSTARISFVCPRFYRNVRCTCNGGLCPGSNDPCMEKPCPGDMQCVGYEASRRPFICQCPPGKLGECSGHTSLSFAGNSYIKYRLSENSKKEEFKLALRLRTLQSNGIIMYTRANPCIILKIVDSKLWFQLDCGTGPGILGISGRAVNDGNWHSVFLELNQNFTSLSLDDSYVERRKAPLYFQTPGTESAIYFGALVQVDNIRSLMDKRVTQVLSGFQGCLDSVVLNNNELPLQNKRSSFAEVVGLTELKLGCVLYPDACERNPCQNGGSCASLPSGGYQCTCLSQFTGRNCESEITACFPNPCRNGGSCDPIGNTFICNCKVGLTGVTCEEDINECDREECENGGSCVNVFGSFLCNCTPGYVGQYCGLRPVVVPNIQAGHSYVGKEELIGIAVVLFVIFVLIVLFIIFRKKVFRKNYSRNNITLVQDPATAALLNKSNGIQFKNLRGGGDSRNIYQEVGPPQVPVRPMAYTPCFQSDSRNNLDKIVDGLGVEHQEMTTFHPESPRILTARRGVVVCSVAPNLPAVSPCRSDCDSIRKSVWDAGTENKGVDDAEEVTCFVGSNKGSNSEVQSLSSFQSDSGDDNASIVTVIQLVNNVVDTIENEVSVMDQGQNYNRAYHWDTSDWMPGARLSDIEEVPNYENPDAASVHQGSTRELETDYYLGGYDIDSEYPPPHEEEFLSQDQLPPPLPEDYPDHFEALPPSQPASLAGTLSPDCRRRPQFHPSQYLPPHSFPNETDMAGPPPGHEFSTFAVGVGQTMENTGVADNMPLSLHNSIGASSSDVSASCGFDDSEVAMSDYESVEELSLTSLHIPFIETQHQTQV
ncbi:protocadherin Fat 3-like [Macrotis lagotis]|uniref:protocadherin Fat 3-like n=1 Tax=Macrotis lagotis TaxID=92651 RepID=UPI003D68BFA2